MAVATVLQILREDIPPEELKKLKALKYSASKVGDKNPMTGKRPGNYKGKCEDGRGYLTEIVSGKRYFVHRIVAAEMIGVPIEEFPEDLDVHHINQNPKDNHPDNLAIVTKTGHHGIHYRYRKSSQEIELRGLSLAGAIQHLTS